METILFLLSIFFFLLCFLSEQWVAFVLNTKLDLWKNLDCNVVLYMHQMLEEIRYIFLNKIVDIVIKICYSYRVTKIKRVKFARISPQSVGFQFEFAYNRMSHNLHRVNIIPLWAYSLDCRFGLCIVFFLFFFRWNVNWRQHRKV